MTFSLSFSFPGGSSSSSSKYAGAPSSTACEDFCFFEQRHEGRFSVSLSSSLNEYWTCIAAATISINRSELPPIQRNKPYLSLSLFPFQEVRRRRPRNTPERPPRQWPTTSSFSRSATTHASPPLRRLPRCPWREFESERRACSSSWRSDWRATVMATQ